MVNENNNINLTIKNEKPFEIVQEVNNEIPSYEEFMKNYNADEKINNVYRGEFDSYGDIRIKGTYYGPGFWDDIKGFVKPVTSGVLIAASVFPPTAAIAMPITLTVVGAGAATMGAGHVIDSKGLKEIGKDIVEIGACARDGQGITESSMGAWGEPSFNEYARSRK